MTAYADYEFYTGTFHGKLIPENDFEHNALLASQYLDAATFGRIAGELSEAVRCACCAVAEIYYTGTVSPKAAAGITSEKVGDHSVTYGSAENASTQRKRLRTAAALWLGNTGLLYKGVP